MTSLLIVDRSKNNMNKLQKKSALRAIAFLYCRCVGIAIVMFFVFLSFDLLAEEGSGTSTAASNGLDVLMERGKLIWNLVSGNAIWDWICKIIGILFCFLIPVGLNQFCPPFRRLRFRKRGKWRNFDFTYAESINSKKIQRDSHYVDFDRKCRKIVRDICSVQNKGVFVVNGPHAVGKRLLTQVEVSKSGDVALLALEWDVWCCIDGKGSYTLKEEFAEKVKRLVFGLVMGKKVYLHLKWRRKIPLPSNEELQKLVDQLSSLWENLGNRRENRLAFILQLPAYYCYMASSDNDRPIEFVTVDFLDFDENYALIWKWGTKKGDGEWTWLTGDQNATDFMEKLKDYYEKHWSVKGETCKSGEICKSESERKKFLWSCTLGIPSASIRLAETVKMDGDKVWDTFCEAVRECVRNRCNAEDDSKNLMALIYLLALRDVLREKMNKENGIEDVGSLVSQLGFGKGNGFDTVANALRTLFGKATRKKVCSVSGECFSVPFNNLFVLPEEKVFRDLLIATFGQIGGFDFRLHLKNGLRAFTCQFVNDSSRETLMNVFADSAAQFGSPSERIVSLTHSFQQVKDLYDDEFPDKYTEFIKAKKLDEVLRLTFDGLLGVCPSQFIVAQYKSIIEDTKGKVDDGILVRLLYRLVQMARTDGILMDSFLKMENVVRLTSCLSKDESCQHELYQCVCLCVLWECMYRRGFSFGKSSPPETYQRIQSLLAEVVKSLPRIEQELIANFHRFDEVLSIGVAEGCTVRCAIDLFKTFGSLQWMALDLITYSKVTSELALDLFDMIKDFHPQDEYLCCFEMRAINSMLTDDFECGMEKVIELLEMGVCIDRVMSVAWLEAIKSAILGCANLFNSENDSCQDQKKGRGYSLDDVITFLNKVITDRVSFLNIHNVGLIMRFYSFLLLRLSCYPQVQVPCLWKFENWMDDFWRRFKEMPDSASYNYYLQILANISNLDKMGVEVLSNHPLIYLELERGWLHGALNDVWSINSHFLSATQKYLYIVRLVSGNEANFVHFVPFPKKDANWDAAEESMKLLRENPRYLDSAVKVLIDQARTAADKDRKTGNDEPGFIFGAAVRTKAQSGGVRLYW